MGEMRTILILEPRSFYFIEMQRKTPSSESVAIEPQPDRQFKSLGRQKPPTCVDKQKDPPHLSGGTGCAMSQDVVDSGGLLHEYPDHPKLEAPLTMLLLTHLYHTFTWKSTVTIQATVYVCATRCDAAHGFLLGWHGKHT